MTNKKEYMIILFLHLPPLVLTQSRVRTPGKADGYFFKYRYKFSPGQVTFPHLRQVKLYHFPNQNA